MNWTPPRLSAQRGATVRGVRCHVGMRRTQGHPGRFGYRKRFRDESWDQLWVSRARETAWRGLWGKDRLLDTTRVRTLLRA